MIKIKLLLGIRINIFVLFCCFSTNIIFAQQQIKFVDSFVRAPTFSDTLEVEMFDNLMIVTANVEHSKKAYRFLFDTGAPVCVSEPLARELKFRPDQKILVGSSGTKKDSLFVGTLKTMTLGDVEFENITAFITDFDRTEMIRCLDIDGIIGANLMNAAVWQIDPLQKRIIVCNAIGRLKNKQGFEAIPMKLVKGQCTPIVNMGVDGHKFKARFDSGFNGFLSMSSQSKAELEATDVLKNAKTLKGNGIASEGIFGTDPPSDLFCYEFNEITLGKNKFLKTPVFMDMNSEMTLLGSALLKHSVIILDFITEKMHIKYLRPMEHDMQKHFGYGMRLQNGSYTIGEVWENSPAAKAGIKFGDVIISINDFDLDNLDRIGACHLLKQYLELAKNSEVKMEIKRDKFVFTVNLKKTNLFEGL